MVTRLHGKSNKSYDFSTNVVTPFQESAMGSGLNGLSNSGNLTFSGKDLHGPSDQ